MLAEELLFVLISELEKEFKLAPTGNCITWRSNYHPNILPAQMENMINKLVYEYQALQFEKKWEFIFSGITSCSFCEIKKTDKFDDVYMNLYHNYKKVQQMKSENDQSSDILKLDYTNDRKLLLNSKFLLAQTRYNSINDRMLRFLINHPNITYSRKDLENEGVLNIQANEDKDFYIFLDDIGMRGDLKKAFFSTELSKDSICLTNPVNKNQLREKGVDFIDLRKLNKSNK